MSARRVLWVSSSTDTPGGVTTFVRTMQRTPLWDKWQIRQVTTHRTGTYRVRLAAFAVGVLSFMWELAVRRPAVVHLHTAAYGSFARKSMLAWICRAAGVPVVLHVHAGKFSEFHERCPRVLQRYIRNTLAGVDRVIALGNRWAGAFEEIAPGARVMVLSNAVHPAEPVDQTVSGPVHVLFVGAMTEDKGALVLLEAWRRLADGMHRSSADLVMVGPGDVERLRQRVEEHGLRHEVHVAGLVDATEVERLLSRSHVLALPSRFEGQPMAILEAMAHGLCVVATEVGGIPDLLDDTCGVLVPADDPDALATALLGVVVDRERRSKLGSCALARVHQKFDVDLAWRELDGLYEELAP